MTEVRDDRYRRRFLEERDRAEAYRNLCLALLVPRVDVDLARFLDEADIAEVVRRRERAQNVSRRG
jgi:hypothetical protein